jgi:hypothetical protein
MQMHMNQAPENFVRCVLTRVKIVASFTEASVLKHAHLLQVRALRSRSCDTRTMRASRPIGAGIDTPRFCINLGSGLATSRLPTSIAVMPPRLVQALGPVLEQIAEMTLKIKQYDRQILELAQSEYPETQALLKVQGRHITALTYVLTLGSKERFKRSRE